MNPHPISHPFRCLWLAGVWLLAAFPAHPETPIPADVPAAAAGATMFRSPAFTEVERLLRAGVEEATVLAYIAHASSTFNLGAEQVIQLGQVGASATVIAAMMQQDRTLAMGRAGAETGAVGGVAPADQAQPAGTAAEVFFDALAPFGTWRNFRDYGWCWQPSVAVADADWRPYRQGGRWLLTEAGWYWTSDYRWGGLVFQYGRWFEDAEWGWCWRPDTRWASAWVTWRQGSDFCGWAPLPPGSDVSTAGVTWQGQPVPWNHDFGLSWDSHTFVTWPQFYNRRPERLAVASRAADGVGQNTTALNDFFLDGKSRAFNRGLPIQPVLEASGEVRTYAVREVPLTPGLAIEADRWATENGVWVLLHPTRTATHSLPAVAATQPTLDRAAAETWVKPYVREIPVLVVTAPKPAQPAANRRTPDLARPATPAAKPLYPMRPTQPVKLTDPILVPRPYSSATANLQIIQLPP